MYSPLWRRYYRWQTWDSERLSDLRVGKKASRLRCIDPWIYALCTLLCSGRVSPAPRRHLLPTQSCSADCSAPLGVHGIDAVVGYSLALLLSKNSRARGVLWSGQVQQLHLNMGLWSSQRAMELPKITQQNQGRGKTSPSLFWFLDSFHLH